MVEANLAQEYALVDFASRLENHRDGRVALYFNLSQLKSQNRREHHVRVAGSMMDEIAHSYDGQLFPLTNGDMVLVLRNVQADIIDDTIVRLRTLFSNDPLANQDDSAGGGLTRNRPPFVQLINIEGNYEQFMTIAQRTLKKEEARQKRLREIGAQSSISGSKTNQSLSVSHLVRLEEVLSMADLSNLLRRQPISQLQADMTFRPVMLELFISINSLAEALIPDVQISANRWLFTHLTQILDQRMLKIIRRGDDRTLERSISLNFNIATVLSQAFMDFDNGLRQEIRDSIMIEFQFVDIVMDCEGFVFARDFLKERGYRVCLDGISSDHMPLIDRDFLGVDVTKITSNRFFNDDAGDEIHNYLGQYIDRIGPKRIILSRCDNEGVIRTGQKMGIQLFQGFYVDQQLQNSSRYGGGTSRSQSMDMPDDNFDVDHLPDDF